MAASPTVSSPRHATRWFAVGVAIFGTAWTTVRFANPRPFMASEIWMALALLAVAGGWLLGWRRFRVPAPIGLAVTFVAAIVILGTGRAAPTAEDFRNVQSGLPLPPKRDVLWERHTDGAFVLRCFDMCPWSGIHYRAANVGDVRGEGERTAAALRDDGWKSVQVEAKGDLRRDPGVSYEMANGDQPACESTQGPGNATIRARGCFTVSARDGHLDLRIRITPPDAADRVLIDARIEWS